MRGPLNRGRLKVHMIGFLLNSSPALTRTHWRVDIAELPSHDQLRPRARIKRNKLIIIIIYFFLDFYFDSNALTRSCNSVFALTKYANEAHKCPSGEVPLASVPVGTPIYIYIYIYIYTYIYIYIYIYIEIWYLEDTPPIRNKTFLGPSEAPEGTDTKVTSAKGRFWLLLLSLLLSLSLVLLLLIIIIIIIIITIMGGASRNLAPRNDLLV